MIDTNDTTNEPDGRYSRSRSIVAFILTAIPMVAVIGYGAVDSLALGILFVVMTLVGLLWLADAWRGGEFYFSSSALQIPLIALIAIAALQLLPIGGSDEAAALLNVPPVRALSLDPYATRFFLIQLVICFLFFAAALAHIRSASQVKKIAAGIVAFGALIAFFGILQRLSVPESIYGLRPTPHAIPFGPFVNQHHFAALMQMTSGIALGLLFGTGVGRERKFMVGLAAGIMGMAVVFTGSRGGVIGFLCVVLFAAVASFVRGRGKRRELQDAGDNSKRNLLVLAAATGLVVLVLGSVLMLGGQESLFRGIGLQAGQTDVTSGRLHFWSIAWKIFLEHPVVGAGFDAFGVAFTRFDTWNGFYRVERAHNDYLQTLADGGILGFACVISFVVIFFKNGISAIGNRNDKVLRSISTGAFAGCFGILIHSFFDFPLRTPANALFFLLLIVLVVANVRIAHRSRVD